MVAQLVKYLLVQGISSSLVTVLAAYSGQVNEIKRLLKGFSVSGDNDVNVQTIDQFQGDKNDFIVVSLVRIGFRIFTYFSLPIFICFVLPQANFLVF